MQNSLRMLCACALVAATATAQTALFDWNGSGASAALGTEVAAPGDLTGDGIPDFVVRENVSGVPTFRAVSGFDGSTAWAFAGTSDSVGPMAASDLNGDGVAEVIVADAPIAGGWVEARSGVDGSTVWTWPVTPGWNVSLRDAGTDLDGDGVGDVLVRMVFFWGYTEEARLLSGATGAQVNSKLTGTNGGANTPMLLLPDVTGDGFGELVVGYSAGLPNQVGVYTSAVFTPAGSVAGPAPAIGTYHHFGLHVGEPGDLDGDGLPELAITQHVYNNAPPFPWLPPPTPKESFTRFYTRAGGVWSQLYALGSFTVHGASRFCAGVGDLDLDGRSDYALFGAPEGVHLGGVTLCSGASGAALETTPVASGIEFPRVARGGDVNLDGVPEFLWLEPYDDGAFFEAGRVRVRSWITAPSASATPLGGACGSTGGGLLTVGPPKLGASTSITWTGAPPSTFGNLAFDFAPPSATVLGGGCVFHLDLAHAATWWLLPILTDASGAVALNLPVPTIPLLAGAPVTVQGVLLGTASPFGFDLSQGYQTVIGY
ncbi:MAG TPA: VCBS repeat-containing protein [Planctomycetota bacterium]|nr:VCBS repeat-containing protein [Planctomycetota bacterium]